MPCLIKHHAIKTYA